MIKVVIYETIIFKLHCKLWVFVSISIAKKSFIDWCLTPTLAIFQQEKFEDTKG